MLETGLHRPLMREILEKLDECEGRLSKLLNDSANDEKEANSPIKATPQEGKPYRLMNALVDTWRRWNTETWLEDT